MLVAVVVLLCYVHNIYLMHTNSSIHCILSANLLLLIHTLSLFFLSTLNDTQESSSRTLPLPYVANELTACGFNTNEPGTWFIEYTVSCPSVMSAMKDAVCHAFNTVRTGLRVS